MNQSIEHGVFYIYGYDCVVGPFKSDHDAQNSPLLQYSDVVVDAQTAARHVADGAQLLTEQEALEIETNAGYDLQSK